jgi:hypothetical protein
MQQNVRYSQTNDGVFGESLTVPASGLTFCAVKSESFGAPSNDQPSQRHINPLKIKYTTLYSFIHITL